MPLTPKLAFGFWNAWLLCVPWVLAGGLVATLRKGLARRMSDMTGYSGKEKLVTVAASLVPHPFMAVATWTPHCFDRSPAGFRIGDLGDRNRSIFQHASCVRPRASGPAHPLGTLPRVAKSALRLGRLRVSRHLPGDRQPGPLRNFGRTSLPAALHGLCRGARIHEEIRRVTPWAGRPRPLDPGRDPEAARKRRGYELCSSLRVMNRSRAQLIPPFLRKFLGLDVVLGSRLTVGTKRNDVGTSLLMVSWADNRRTSLGAGTLVVVGTSRSTS